MKDSALTLLQDLCGARALGYACMGPALHVMQPRRGGHSRPCCNTQYPLSSSIGGVFVTMGSQVPASSHQKEQAPPSLHSSGDTGCWARFDPGFDQPAAFESCSPGPNRKASFYVDIIRIGRFLLKNPNMELACKYGTLQVAKQQGILSFR